MAVVVPAAQVCPVEVVWFLLVSKSAPAGSAREGPTVIGTKKLQQAADVTAAE